jgi:hypothetical protein
MLRRFLRENAFLAAAVCLPLVVIVFFLLFTIVPQWMVPAPKYDLLVQTNDYDQGQRRVAVEVFVRDDRLQATIRPAGQNTYPARVRVWRIDHSSLTASEIQIDVPESMAEGASSTVIVDALRGQRVVATSKAPDGYDVQTATHRGPGLVGDLFGMRRYDQGLVLMNRGRVISIKIPSPNSYQTPTFVGWLLPEGAR